MVQMIGRKKLIAAVSVIVALVLIISVFAIAKTLLLSKSADSSETSSKDAPSTSDEDNDTNAPVSPSPDTTVPEVATESPVDPSTVATVDIEPVTLTVSYSKGVGGFDFEVLRTPSGTRYVQFSSPKLVGTKCTDDKGAFASIIEKPTADESTTLAKTTTVDGTAYGLSLAESTCTSNSDLLKQYQDAFSKPFSLLKKT
jgi:hypothetical protein